MICDHCDQPILPGQPSVTRTVETGSGAAPEVRMHKGYCWPNAWEQPNRSPLPRTP